MTTASRRTCEIKECNAIFMEAWRNGSEFLANVINESFHCCLMNFDQCVLIEIANDELQYAPILLRRTLPRVSTKLINHKFIRFF
jgi:hypothetical protein